VHFRSDSRYGHTLLWWLAVLLIAVALKHHYSVATASQLDWMLRPLARVLEVFTGQAFVRAANGEWLSPGADVRLVKACAGVNFMLMSFLVYAWLMRPVSPLRTGALSWAAGRVSLLYLAVIAAWLTALFANALRIVLAMQAESRGWHLDAAGLHAADVHRLIGMLVYLPLLSLQMMANRRATGWQVLVVPFLLYLLLTMLVPMLTGNAWHDPALFLRHLLSLACIGGVVIAVPLLLRRAYAV
jgi:exosortase K